ncbi:MAG TPA: single-stranded-DNA-specific exonuclease RecJ [Rectinemataceae bacterium]|nr:single-stranded-DNA-specific exonuclease RecJ [Rectinemataceae bacterium]
MNWNKKDIPAAAVRELASRYGTDPLTATILLRRGLSDPEDLLFFLEDDPRYLHNPFLFSQMEDAVDRILLAVDEGEKVLVFGDRDVDGVTSTVLMVEALRELGLDVSWRVPRSDEPYGLSIAAVETFAAEGGTLIVAVDCGISNGAEVDRASELMVDVIIVDHHRLQSGEPPAAVAVINPKLADSGYPFRDLAGCGVAYKVASALKLAHSGIYKQQVALLNVQPVNDAYLVEAVRLTNLVETGRVRETIVPGMVGLEGTRLAPFLRDRQIFVWGGEMQRRLLAKAFGDGIDWNFYDIAPDVGGFIAQTSGQSLIRLKELSRIGRYRSEPLSEIDVFENLFVSFALKKADWFGEDDLRRLQLVALGTIADLMPLRDENRILVRRGLAAINSSCRAGLAELLQKLGLLGKRLGAGEASWQVTPVINAAGRMGEPDAAVSLFLAEGQVERENLADRVIQMNLERRRIGAEEWELVYPRARESLAEHGDKLVVVGGEDIHRGITGLIASKLTGVLGVPAVVASFQDGGVVVGSIRSARGFAVTPFLEACADLFIDYGGHDAAAGFSMPRERWPEFLSRAGAYAEGIELSDAEESIEVDAELPRDFLKPELASLSERFEPYGEENRPLTFLSRDVPIVDAQLVGKKEQNHLKLTLDFGKHKWPALFWDGAQRLERDFSFKDRDRIDLVFKVTVNRWNGMEQPQLEVFDACRAGERGRPEGEPAEPVPS